ncbi:MAG: chromosome segregation protein SMC [Bacteroidota bacterium]
MLLTKLELKGFKSFGDKVTINFDEGITGIVGPNGCGKSNVVDAIRWVLGEQKTRMLRSDKMENVIFNGTKKRKPTQLAEVSLTFDNTKNLLPTEYSSITITRRYYRSGDSDYELNGVSCRLKDIQNLFLDTGIASNSYAIIELKMVDDLLNDKDNSRRSLFEEAAGISKFRIRKKETLKKLGDTDADLERVEDLLFEIEKNLKSLERQAKQTEKYYQLKKEYKTLSIELAKIKVSKELESLQNLGNKIEQENDQKTALNTKRSELEAKLEKLKNELVNREKLLSTRQRSLNEHVGKIRQYESEKRIKNERLKFLNDRSDKLREQLEHDRKSNERAHFSIQGLERDKISVEKELEKLSDFNTKLKEELDEQKEITSKIQEELNEQQDQSREKKDNFYQLSKAIEIKEIQLSSLEKELEQTTSDTEEHTENLAEFEEKIKNISETLKSKQSEYDKLVELEENLQNKITDNTKTVELIKDELSENKRQLDRNKNEYNLTKSLVDNLEGFPEAIKFLKKKSSWGKDAPLISDIITCEEDYRVTIENYLEPFMNYYVVESENHAFEAVNLLNEASQGKANFFILNSFRKFEPSITKMYEKATAASEIIEYDAKYRKLIGHLLDRVYIVDGDFSDIPEDPDSIFITKNGKVTIRRHTISGGSVGLFEGKRIGRAKNLEKLDKKIKVLNSRIDEIEQNLDKKTKENERLKESTQKFKVDDLRSEINQLNQQLVSIQTKKEQFDNLITSNTTRREDLVTNADALRIEIGEEKPKVLNFEEELKALEEKAGHLKAELTVQQQKLSEKSTTYNEAHIKLLQKENAVKSMDQEISYKHSAYESSKERIEKNASELSQNDEEIKKLISKSEIDDDELIEMYAEKDTIETGVNEAEKEYYSGRGEIDEVEKSIREIQRSRETSDTLLMELQNKLNETKMEVNSVKERLSVEFDVNLDVLIKNEEAEGEPYDPEELENKVQRCRQRMDNMGAINPMAMEAYEEIKERHEFITTQKADLVKAKESLMSTISEIDEVAKTTFLEAFHKIKDNFIKVFRTLFTEEDDCDLLLSSPEDPLNSSIEIIAKPKGKRPLTINQLSGGEKTLTATSLLFSIYLLKPAPFCIFDEVDAPLDDANIDKFNNIIREFSKESQFIIVTHNKRTMVSTDIIYGITMIEQGVSRVVPVDLREIA